MRRHSSDSDANLPVLINYDIVSISAYVKLYYNLVKCSMPVRNLEVDSEIGQKHNIMAK